MQQLFAVRISLGSIAAAQKRLSQALVEPVVTLNELVEQQSVCLVDETRVERKAGKPWLWVKATAQATVLRILPRRSQKNAGVIIGGTADGIGTFDCYPGFYGNKFGTERLRSPSFRN